MILTCEACLATTQINYELTVEPTPIRFCPLCASGNTRVRQDMDDESWFVISQSLGLPVPATKALYKIWQTTFAHEDKNFCNWVRLRQSATNNSR